MRERTKWKWMMLVLSSGALGCWVLACQQTSAWAEQRVPPAAAATGLITHVFHTPDRPTKIVVVDPVQRRIAVYFVSLDSGQIQLKSVRNIAGDLALQEFNSDDPSPRDILNLQQRN